MKFLRQHKLTFAWRIMAGYILVFGIASWVFYDSLIEEIKPVVRQASESALIDTANLLAELVAEDVATNNLYGLEQAISKVKTRRLNAEVWQHLRTEIILNFYITDAQGVVIFSSENKDVGADYSQWRDVYLTLKGQYGARSTVFNPYDEGAKRIEVNNSVMHVAAPIISNEALVGVLTVYNPNQEMQPFIDASRHKVLVKWLIVLIASGMVALLLSYWLSRSVTRLAKFAQKAQQGEPVVAPKLLGTELNMLANAVDEMRIKLQGKAYVEHYVQTLTHELKSPMAAVQGAVEMLKEDLPSVVREKFIGNICDQNQRMQRTVNQLLRLAALENQAKPDLKKHYLISRLLNDALAQLASKAELLGIEFIVQIEQDFNLPANAELLTLGINNLLDNALEFSDGSCCINVQVKWPALIITDKGVGIPDYALEQIGTRFFSLPRPSGAAKSTGLGIVLSHEVARMHSAKLSLANRCDGQAGVVACIEFNRAVRVGF